MDGGRFSNLRGSATISQPAAPPTPRPTFRSVPLEDVGGLIKKADENSAVYGWLDPTDSWPFGRKKEASRSWFQAASSNGKPKKIFCCLTEWRKTI